MTAIRYMTGGGGITCAMTRQRPCGRTQVRPMLLCKLELSPSVMPPSCEQFLSSRTLLHQNLPRAGHNGQSLHVISSPCADIRDIRGAPHYCTGESTKNREQRVVILPIPVAGQDPAKELVVVANVANNPLAFLNDPLGTGHAANVIDVLAWDGDKKELHILIFAGTDTIPDAVQPSTPHVF